MTYRSYSSSSRRSVGLLVAALAILAILCPLVRANASPPTPVSLANPGFESPFNAVDDMGGNITGELANRWYDWSYGTVSAVYAQETSDPHSGNSCQKATITSASSGSGLQIGQPVQLKGGSIYTLSVWLRGTPGSFAFLSLQLAASPYTSYANAYSLPLTDSWQQYTVEGYVPDDVAGAVLIGSLDPGTFWVDDVSASYVPGKIAPTPNIGPIQSTFFGMHVANWQNSTFKNGGMEPPFIAVGPIGSAISGVIADHWQDNSSWANVNVVYSEDTNAPHGGKSAQKVAVNAVTTGAVQLVQPMAVVPGRAYTMSAWLRGPAGSSVNLVFQNAIPPYNYYGETPVQLTGDWQQATVSGTIGDTGEVLLMIQAVAPVTFSVDDVAFVDAAGHPVSSGVPWPKFPVGTLRLWDSSTAWTNLEPAKGQWDFKGLDAWVNEAQKRKVQDIILTLGQTPAWASSDPSRVSYYGAGAPAPPSKIQDWIDYVGKVAQRYKGKIRYFEIWNEPNDINYYSGSIPELVQLTSAAYTAIKAVDPGNTVILSPAYSPGYVDALLSAGAASFVDVIGYHSYTTPPEDTARILSDVRLVMANHGLSTVPLWDTEAASGDTSTPTREAADYLVRKYLTDLAFGSVHYDWYTWGPATAFCVGTEQIDRFKLTGAGRAYGILQGWLTTANLTKAVIDRQGNWQIWLGFLSGGKGLVVWNPSRAKTFTIPAGITVTEEKDIFGKTLAVNGPTVSVSPSPLLLVGN